MVQHSTFNRTTCPISLHFSVVFNTANFLSRMELQGGNQLTPSAAAVTRVGLRKSHFTFVMQLPKFD